MARGDELRLSTAKRAYRNAAAEGNHQEEARWANVVGDILKNRGEYVEALKWFRIDYEVSLKFLPQKQLLATCQSLGEVYLRLEFFKDALIYQKKHLELAKDSNDVVEQQRASTQLARTYHEMFLRSDDDHCSVRNAKKYFHLAMNLAKTLKQNPPAGSTSFLKEYIDAHNNIGMLEIDLDNLEEAERILTKGLGICDEEEMGEDDDGRTRLHHNLGKVYLELRKWDDARVHIEKDIMICNRIGHCQGEAKGYINLGELHYRVQKCEEAISCYEKALKLAKSMEDEDALADQIHQNIVIVKEALKVLDDLKKEEQDLKKLIRKMLKARGTARERKCLLQQNACLDRLIEKSSMISAWLNHRCYAKEKKRIATELCDKEKLGDSFLVLGESYRKLRNFSEALQCYTKSWEIYKSIGNLEGQALAKINIGDVLDSDGNWEGALNAFEEGYGIALQANLPSVQLSALENMHYSHMIRFDNVEEARRLQLLIDKLKQSISREHETNVKQDCCSETDTDGDCLQTNGSDVSCSNNTNNSDIGKGQSQTQVEDKENVPIVSLKHAKKNASKFKPPYSLHNSEEQTQVLLETMTNSQQALVGRKHIRVILSDDEEGEAHAEVMSSKRRCHDATREDVATSEAFKSWEHHAGEFQDVSLVASKCVTLSGSPTNLEESICSYPEIGIHDTKNLQTSSTCEAINNSIFNENITKSCVGVSRNTSHNFSSLYKHACCGECGHILLKIEENFVHVDPSVCMVGGKLSTKCMKVEVACLYYLQLPADKRSQGLLPIIQHLRCCGRALDTLEEVDNLRDHFCGKGWVDVSIGGWVQKHLMKLYIDCCKELSEPPNLKLLKKLYNLELSEDEVVVSDCELLDVSIIPLLKALEVHKTVAVLDFSHNSLGNGTVEKLQKVLTTGQRYGGLVLDLHQNVLGPGSLFQICECPVLFSRLEVLNVSGNRLTDACGYCLSSILKNCKALYSLSVERCSITSRTIQKIADALQSDSVLSDIAIGYNNPVSASTIINLLGKLATLKRFSELNLSGLKLGKPVVNSLCQLTKTSCFSTLILGDSSLGTECALQLIQSFIANQELAKLDLSSCELTSEYVVSLNTKISLFSNLVELNLGGNPIMQEGGNAMVSLIKNPLCNLKVLVLSKCQLGLSGIIRILQALTDNRLLEELNLAKNVNKEKHHMPLCDTSDIPLPEEVDAAEQESFVAKMDINKLEVADSEDDQIPEFAVSGCTDCVSSSQRKVSSQESPLVQKLSTAIGMAKHLKLLDLSDNGLSKEMAKVLYAAWSCSRADLAQRHIQEKIIHFSLQGHKCCGVKPCCRKD